MYLKVQLNKLLHKNVNHHILLKKTEHQMKTPDLKNHNQNLYLDFPYLAEH